MCWWRWKERLHSHRSMLTVKNQSYSIWWYHIKKNRHSGVIFTVKRSKNRLEMQYLHLLQGYWYFMAFWCWGGGTICYIFEIWKKQQQQNKNTFFLNSETFFCVWTGFCFTQVSLYYILLPLFLRHMVPLICIFFLY